MVHDRFERLSRTLNAGFFDNRFQNGGEANIFLFDIL
jgi:hypothetical protein